jgi:hypothetical protein
MPASRHLPSPSMTTAGGWLTPLRASQQASPQLLPQGLPLPPLSACSGAPSGPSACADNSLRRSCFCLLPTITLTIVSG